MGRLIDADALAEILKREAEHHEADGLLERSYGVLDAYMDVLQAPTVHPEPQKIAKWVDNGDPLTIMCGGCGYSVMRYNNTPFCPNCGAMMEGTDDYK